MIGDTLATHEAAMTEARLCVRTYGQPYADRFRRLLIWRSQDYRAYLRNYRTNYPFTV